MNKGEQTKELILTTATALFAKKGYLGVSMQDLCDETGLSRGGLYRHYDSCQTILSCIITRLCHNQSVCVLSKIQKQTPAREIVDELFQIYEQEIIDNSASLSLAICEYYRDHQDDRMKQVHEQTKDMWRTLLKYGISSKEFHQVDMEAFIDRWLFSYQGLRMWSIMMPVKESAKRIIEQTKKELYV